jgi:hypothetical protein
MLCLGMVCLFLLPQTEKLGENVYYNGEGIINLAVDATVAVYDLDKAYVPFLLFMGTDAKSKAKIHRDGVSLLFNKNLYHMPDIREFRKNYKGESRDMKIYAQFGKTNLVSPKMHHLRFQKEYDFFPQRTESTLLIDETEITGLIGFATWIYFANPGFKVGDSVVIKVVDKENQDIWGSVSFELGSVR